MSGTSFFSADFFGGDFFLSAPVTPPTPQGVTGGGGGVSKWPGRSEFGWEKWRRLEDKKLARQKKQVEKKVETLQKEVKEARKELSQSRDLKDIQRLMKVVERIQAQLDKANKVLDEIEMQEVLLIWTLTR